MQITQTIATKGQPVLTLPGAWYSDPEIFAAERTRIFGKSWQLAGPLSSLQKAGDYMAIEILGWRVFVIRNREGELRAFHNVCRHRAGPLLDEGRGHCDILRCRYHLWVYDTDGNLRRTPAFGEADWFDKKDYSLFPVKVATWRGLVFVNLDMDAGPLEAALGDLIDECAPYPMESFTFVREETFDIACNWKTYTDNFVEGYHIPGIHAGLKEMVDMEKFQTTGRNQIVVMEAPQRDGSIYGGVWTWAFPNMTLSIFPGGMNTSRIMPIDPKRSRLIYNFYFRDISPEGTEARRRTIETNCGIVREDFGICETAQGNIDAGRYTQGPLSPRHEDGVRYFHELVRNALAG
jgi:choline monooxygenase